METLQTRVETWIKDQSNKILLRVSTWPPPWRKWPPWSHNNHQKKIAQELERRKKQLQEFCYAVKADSVPDLQEILCCMVLSECVYKRPTEEMMRHVNKFKADFGGELVSLERVQPSSDHVPHRYLLAEAGDTLFASFIGTKQYKDLMADANIFQGAIFHEDVMPTANGIESTELDGEINEGTSKTVEMKTKQTKLPPAPAVHRGFMARAKGIPALELYRLAQKKRRKLVLCGHSLGGAVAVLATLAILRVVAVSSKESERVPVKCITFSQPPVGNAALRDYVNGNGWQHYFKTYCIPQDLVPRILSPAYFHHYNDDETFNQKTETLKESEGEQLVLGLGPVQNSFWRLSRLVPIEGVRRQFNKYTGRKVDPLVQTSPGSSDSGVGSSIDDIVTAPQSLEIEESSDGISLRPLPENNEEVSEGAKIEKSAGINNSNGENKRAWRSIPSLPSYVPFGQDLVPRILSPAYFHHYNDDETFNQKTETLKESEGEQLVLGLGPVQNSFWRLSRLVPIEGVRRQFNKYTGRKVDPLVQTSPGSSDSGVGSSIDDIVTAPQSLEIEESSDGISLRPLPENNEEVSEGAKIEKSAGINNSNGENKRAWRSIPSLPSYVPFGQLYLLGDSSVESLSGSEYSKLTSVRSVITEVRERFQSHSMKSYRSRFQRMFEVYLSENAFSLLGWEQEVQFTQLQKWMGISVAGAVELGHIVESPVIRAATSLVPLGWNGMPSDKNGDQLKVDISGFGLHLCTLVQARVNGNWCSTTVECFPSLPSYSPNHELKPEMQKMRILVGAPLKRPPKHQILEDKLMPVVFPSIDSTSADLKLQQNVLAEERFILPEGLRDFVVLCTTDFSTVAKEVYVRARRVRLIGLEGAGKTSLLKAILDQGRPSNNSRDAFPVEMDVREGIAGGLFYSDSMGVNLQNLTMEASLFRDELWKGIRDLSKKIDLVVLVHNLSHRIPRYDPPDTQQSIPALSLLLDEAKSLGVPYVLAITNKFSVSAHQQKSSVNAVLQAYQASPSITEVVNSCPYVMPSATGSSLSWSAVEKDSAGSIGGPNIVFAPLNLVRKPFQKKPTVLPVDGVAALRHLVHGVLRSKEEDSLQELARDRIFLELARERAAAGDDGQAKNSLNAAAVGASVGAGVGIILAVVMGAASALRKP